MSYQYIIFMVNKLQFSFILHVNIYIETQCMSNCVLSWKCRLREIQSDISQIKDKRIIDALKKDSINNKFTFVLRKTSRKGSIKVRNQEQPRITST